MCLRGIASALCALSLGVGLDKVSADVSLRLVTVIVSNLAELIGFFALLRYISLINIQIPLKYNLQRRYLLFWLTVYNVFMIYLLDMGNIAAAERRAAEILSLLAKGTDCKGRKQTITASIGIAPIDGTVNSFSDAYNRADLALYQVKHRKKNGYAVYGETGPGESPAPQ